MSNTWMILLCCLAAHVHTCLGSAWLQDPPSRSAAWYYQIRNPVNYNFRNLNCGDVPVKIESNGSRNCGVCGDRYTDPTPRANELGGTYANPRIRTRYYESGQVAEISIWNNLPGAPGFYEFRLCDEELNQSQDCLNKNLLIIDDTETTYMSVPQTQGLVMIHVQLPSDVTCDFCLLQWRFRKESIAGCDDDNWCGQGRGAQIEYYNCADVMIGAVGQPKPSFIEDPTFTASDYGSAYDIVTSRTTSGPTGSNLVGNTTTTAAATTTSTTTTTTGVPIFTIPTVFPTGTTTTSGTTKNPVTTTAGTMPITERLVVDINGNAISGQSTFGSGRTINNKSLLILLSLLPLLGAFGIQNSRGAALAQPVHVVPSVPVSWATTFPMYPIQFENTFGYGNFKTGGLGFSGTSAYASKNYQYGGTSGLTGVFPNNVYPNNLLQTQSTQAVLNNRNTINKINGGFLNNGAYFNNGGGNFVQKPVVWNRNGVTVNNGLTNHVFPRSTGSQTGTPYKPSSSQYPNPSRSIPSIPISSEYNTNHQSGYTPNGNFVPSNSGISAQGKTWWHNDGIGERINQWPHSGGTLGSTNWSNNGVNQGHTHWQNNGGFNGGNNNFNKHGVGTGQRLTVPETIPQRMRIVSASTSRRDHINLHGVESAARFQTTIPRHIIDASHPLIGGNLEIKSKNALIQNGGGLLNTAFSRTRNGRLTGSSTFVNGVDDGNVNQEPVLVHDWYNKLLRRFPGRETRLL